MPLERARTYAMCKLGSADDRKRYEKCDRYFETLHDNFISKLEGVSSKQKHDSFLLAYAALLLDYRRYIFVR